MRIRTERILVAAAWPPMAVTLPAPNAKAQQPAHAGVGVEARVAVRRVAGLLQRLVRPVTRLDLLYRGYFSILSQMYQCGAT